MKKDIHPTYHTDAVITCACGATYTAGSTEKEIKVEICSACHPFYTGKQKFVDTAGRVDKFRARMAAKQAPAPKKDKAAKAKETEEKESAEE